jgi:hypothetical protein
MLTAITQEAILIIDGGSDEALVQLREWCEMHPGVVWTVATVHRDHGLTLISDPAVFHITPMPCGFIGSGPKDCAKALEITGFGDYDELLAKVESRQTTHRFSKE